MTVCLIACWCTFVEVDVDFIPGLVIPQLPQLIRVSEIKDFEGARQVFLRGASHIETAKKYYELDGKSSYGLIGWLVDWLSR